MTQENITREQWMLGVQLAGSIRACNAPFCYDGTPVAVEADPNYVANVASVIAKHCSVMMLQDCLDVLTKALQLKQQADHSGVS